MKDNIHKIGVSPQGINVYSFQYKNESKHPVTTDEVRDIYGSSYRHLYRGVIAQELLDTKYEDAVSVATDGYYSVNYTKLDVDMKRFDQNATVADLCAGVCVEQEQDTHTHQ